MGVREGCEPRREVLEGELHDSIFAADFGHLLAKQAPAVYQNAKLFFQNTHPAAPLRKIAQTVFGRLGDPREAGAVLRLSTGFGGGKTHTLMALYHLAQNIGDPSMGTEVLPAAGRPKKVSVVAIDATRAGVPVFARHPDCEVKSLAGELFYRLGGKEAVKRLGAADTPEGSPDEGLLRSVLPDGPLLILLDELVVYMAKLSDAGQGNLLGFLRLLMSSVTARTRAVLVLTDPAQQVSHQKEAAQLASIAAKLSEQAGRQASDFEPIGSETAQVIVRRLFDRVDRTAAEAASATYHQLYQRVAAEKPSALPKGADGLDYAERVRDSYPFHPRLMLTAESRLAVLPEFNKSRGTLRLFARLLRELWSGSEDPEAITAGDIDWSNAEVQNELLQRLHRDNFRAAASADVDAHAGMLDGGKRGVHRRVASALLLESLPMNEHSGLAEDELTLAVLRPDEAGGEPVEAMHRLSGVCWHTYPMHDGRGWQFRYEPNILKLIEERQASVPREDALERVRAEIQGFFSGGVFKLAAWPKAARAVSETAQLQLALCETEALAKSVCANADDTDPNAPMPRRFVNAIVAVTATPAALENAIQRAQRLIAAEAIDKEGRTSETAKMAREQLKRIKPELDKGFRLQAFRAFDRVVLGSGQSFAIDEQHQFTEEQAFQRPHGQETVRRFLEAKNLIYKPADALDLPRFLSDVFAGATPLADEPEARSAKALHERFLSARGLRLVPDPAVVRQTILKGIAEGVLVVRQADGNVHDRDGVVRGPAGQRKRTAGERLTTLALDDDTHVARADSGTATTWLKVDAGEQPQTKVTPPPPPPGKAASVATTADEALRLAGERALVELALTARKPADANALPALATPLGATTLMLDVLVSGDLKEGGQVAFKLDRGKLNHPIRPLTIAQTLFNALAQAGITFEAKLTLEFGPDGRTVQVELLRALLEALPEGASFRARFKAAS